jgi:tetratricopeptide (TPR) repeat protein/predicted Ser/Thr protein kinase
LDAAMSVRTVEGSSTLEIDVAERPASDRLAMDRARARAERALFGRADPARLGRYEILDPIASGGMGFVYAAHDPDLDRRVALKVLHPDRRRDAFAHERLIKEARALARLDHPNIVPVHDALNHDGELVMVMELVTGETLESWQTAEPRSWREVVDAYLQAGAGLAAAHGLDIIHRDFKPSNAIMGADGRVRVLDFGLARFVGEASEPGTAGAPRAGLWATASGAILGTPGYAAPEQLAGERVTAASDQFSFCVALHRALEGVAPFRGTTADELLASIRRDPPAVAGDGRCVPSWLRAVLRRGLAADPARRHASMQALLDELSRPRGWKRWRWPVVATVLAATTATAALGLREAADRLPGCEEDDQGLAAVWNPSRRVGIAIRLQQLGTPYLPEVQDRVLDALDRWAPQWTAVHRTACLAHRRGAESDAMFDRKMLCLRQRLDDVAAALRVLDGLGRADLSRAIDVVVGSASPQACADSARLLTEPDPPATPELRARVARLRAELSAGAALARAGRAEQATQALGETSREAERTAWAPVIAEAKLAYARVLIMQGDHASATPVLREAMTHALATHQDRLAVEAAARRIFTEAVRSADLERLARDLDFVEPMSAALTADHFARPLLLNNVGVAYMAAGRRDDALRYFQRAHDEIDRTEPLDLELTIVDQNIAMLTPDAATRKRLSRERWIQLEDTLGEHHPSTLDAQLTYANLGADLREAYELTRRACTAYHDFHPALVVQYVDCQGASGLLASELELGAAARAAYAAVVDATAGTRDGDLIASHRLAAGELAVLRGEPAEARAQLAPVVDAYRDSAHWWERHSALRAELGLGLTAAATGDRAAAVRYLEAAVRGLAEIASMHQSIVYRLQLARARRALASLRPDSPEREAANHH